MIIDIGEAILDLSPELRIQPLKECFQTQVWLVMYPSRIWIGMKDFIMDTELMSYRIIKVGRDIRRPLVPRHDQSTSINGFIQFWDYVRILSSHFEHKQGQRSQNTSEPLFQCLNILTIIIFLPCA